MTEIDPRAPRFNQGIVGVGALVAFLFSVPIVLPFLALALGAGAFLGPQANPLAILWRRAIVPAFKLGAPLAKKDAAPVRFAMAVGFVFLTAASGLLLTNVLPIVGWALTLIVAALALLAAVTDICVGCEIYVLLKRWTARPTRS